MINKLYITILNENKYILFFPSPFLKKFLRRRGIVVMDFDCYTVVAV